MSARINWSSVHVRQLLTFDLSPELAITEVPEDSDAKASFVRDEIPEELVVATRKRVGQAGLSRPKRVQRLACLCLARDEENEGQG